MSNTKEYRPEPITEAHKLVFNWIYQRPVYKDVPVPERDDPRYAKPTNIEDVASKQTVTEWLAHDRLRRARLTCSHSQLVNDDSKKGVRCLSCGKKFPAPVKPSDIHPDMQTLPEYDEPAEQEVFDFDGFSGLPKSEIPEDPMFGFHPSAEDYGASTQVAPKLDALPEHKSVPIAPVVKPTVIAPRVSDDLPPYQAHMRACRLAGMSMIQANAEWKRRKKE